MVSVRQECLAHPLSHLGSIMGAALSNMDHGMAFAQKATRNHPADDQLVVAGCASIRDSAIKKGQSILEDGRATVDSLHIHIRKSWFLFREAPAEMNEHVRLGIIQNIHDKPGAFRQPGGDLSAFPEGHANERWIKGALLHPAGEHAGLGLAPARRQDKEPAGDPPQGRQQLAARVTRVGVQVAPPS